MKVLLLNYLRTRYCFDLASVYTSLKNHTSHKLFCKNYRSDIDTIEFIKENKIDCLLLVGEWRQLSLISKIRKLDYDIIIAAGGYIFTEPEIGFLAMEYDGGYLDYGITGCGEQTTINLLNAIENNNPISQVKGIVYRNFENIVYTGDADYQDINDYELPDLNAFNPDGKQFAYNESIPIRIGRGCRNTHRPCKFCPITSYDYSTLKIEKLADYVESNYSSRYTRLELAGGFDYDSKDIAYLLDRFNSANIHPEIRFVTEAYYLNEHDIDMFKKLNVRNIFIGIESIHDAILEEYNKGVSSEIIEQAMKVCYEKGIWISGAILVGNPLETKETITKSIEWLETHRKYGAIRLVTTKLFPGAKYYKEANLSIEEKIHCIRTNIYQHYPLSEEVAEVFNRYRDKYSSNAIYDINNIAYCSNCGSKLHEPETFYFCHRCNRYLKGVRRNIAFD